MSATALPLPLELTKPVPLAADLDTQLRESLGVGTYDPKLQISMWYHGGHGGRETETKCEINCGSLLDFKFDDLIAFEL